MERGHATVLSYTLKYISLADLDRLMPVCVAREGGAQFFLLSVFFSRAMSLREGGKELRDEGGRGLEWLKNFDVFPKTVDDAKEVSVSGGSVMLLYRTEKLRAWPLGPANPFSPRCHTAACCMYE